MKATGMIVSVLLLLADQVSGFSEDYNQDENISKQYLKPITNVEYQFIRKERAAATSLSSAIDGLSPTLRVGAARHSTLNNEPDKLVLTSKNTLNKLASSRRRRFGSRFVRSISNIPLPVNEDTQGRRSVEPLTVSHRHQLPELIAQAHNDKALERALLRRLINTSLLSQAATASSSTTQDDTNSPAGNALEAIDSNLLSPALLAKLQQLQQQATYEDYPANVDIEDALSAVGGNGFSDTDHEFPTNPTNKKIMLSKPCLFNAIDCPSSSSRLRGSS